MEFALVLPLLLMLVFGVIQFGLVMAQKASLASGARDGARIGSVNILGAHTCADITSRVQSGASTVGLAASSVVVTVERLDTASTTGAPACSAPTVTPCTGGNDQSRLRVTASAPDTTIVIPPLFSVGPFDLASEGVYRCEYS